MFDISWGKLVIIGVVALLVIGPKELPAVLRMLGQYMGKMRRMASEFQGQFQEAMREAEMADLKKQFDDTTSSFQSSLDPTGFKNDIEKMIQDPVAPVATEPSATSTPATPPSDPAAVATPATASPEATPPADPVALATAPVAPATQAPEVAPAADVTVPMPELPPPVDSKDFAPAPAKPAPVPPAPAAEGGKAA
jgi:sec-independent protein translocase protein TatB